MAKILIVDDDSAVQATIRLLLERAGHSVVVADDGRKGLAVFEAGDFDLLFLDIFMPGMDGLETMRLVHQQQPLLPIIVISGNPITSESGSGADFLTMASKLGAVSSLQKPFRPAALLAVGIVGAFITFLVASSIVSGTPAAVTISDAGVVRSLLGAGLYLGLVGVIGTALGALLRSVAGGISVLVAALMLIPGLISLLPSSWQNTVKPYLPSDAGQSMFALHHAAHTLTPTAGLLVFVGWTALALAGAAWRLVRTDA